MRVIIDTHTYLWYINGNKELSQKAYSIIDNICN